MGEKERNEDELTNEATTTQVEEEIQADDTVVEEVAGEVVEEVEETVDATEDAEGSEKKGKGFFKKEKKKDKKDEQIEELNDRLIRSIAEFDNFRKRSEKEKSMMFEMGAKDIIEKVLPVIDNFERGLNSISEEEREGAFAKGLKQSTNS